MGVMFRVLARASDVVFRQSEAPAIPLSISPRKRFVTTARGTRHLVVFGGPPQGAESTTIVAAGIPSAEAFGSPAIGAGIGAAGVATGEELGSPAIAAAIVSAGIASAEAVGEPIVGDIPDHPIDCVGIESGEAFGRPTIGGQTKTGGRAKRKGNPFLRFKPASEEEDQPPRSTPAVAKVPPAPQASGLLKALLARGLQQAPPAVAPAAPTPTPAQARPAAAPSKPEAIAPSPPPAPSPAPDVVALIASMERRLDERMASIDTMVEQRVAARVEQLQQRVAELEQDLALALSLVAMVDAGAQARQESRAQERKARDLRAENERRARRLAEALLKD